MSGPAPRIALAIASLSSLVVASAQAADSPHGWSLTLSAGANSTTAHAASAAFALGAGESLHPEFGPRGYKATFDGMVTVPEAGAYRFGVDASGGAATLELSDAAGQPLGKCTTTQASPAMTGFVKLAPGPVAVRVTFTRGAEQEARLRTLWELQPSKDGGFRDEPIPSSAVVVPEAQAAAVREADEVVEGRALLERKGCTNCHAPSEAAAVGLARRTAPNLDGVATRAGKSWLMRWIEAPHSIRAGADMPDLFPDAEDAREDAGEFVAWFSSLSARADAPLDPKEANGRRLFHTIGCSNCHGPFESPADVLGDPSHPSAVPKADWFRPFGDLAGKWRVDALAGFLLDPHAVYPDGRMPSLSLSPPEAESLAAYLVRRFETAAPDAALVARGKEAFAKYRCNACHSVGGAPLAAPAARPLAELSADASAKGCLDPASKTSPRFDLTDAERAKIARGIASAQRAKSAPAPIDACAKARAFLNCSACHSWDGAGGLTADLKEYATLLDERVDLGDEGRVPPDLTSVGFKLRSSWIAKVVHGGVRARPYMATRMPEFSSPWAEHLPEQLAQRDGVVPESDVEPGAQSDQSALTGRQLAGQDGMNCISCHVFKDYPAPGSPGPSLSDFARRLRYEWWRSYLQGPSRYKPGTRMPAFSIGRASNLPDVLGGDIYAQGDALWAWFSMREKMPVPKGLEAAGQLKIDVGDRPVVLRSFLRNAGVKGIAVGLPVGIHYSFDGRTARLAEVWQGDFINATNVWAGRGGMQAEGQGPTLWLPPPGPPLVVGDAPAAWPDDPLALGWKFLGYSLDAQGTPTFRTQVGDVTVRERIEASASPKSVVRRAFEVEGLPPGGCIVNAGPGNVALKDLGDCASTPVEAKDGARFRITPESGKTKVRFVVEVTP